MRPVPHQFYFGAALACIARKSLEICERCRLVLVRASIRLVRGETHYLLPKGLAENVSGTCASKRPGPILDGAD